MIENAQKGRLEELVEIEQQVIVLSAELAKYKDIASRWQIEFDVKIEHDQNHYFVVVTAHTEKSSVKMRISEDTVYYYKGEVESFARGVTRKLVAELISDEAEKVLIPKMAAAFKNIQTIKDRQ